MSVSAKAGPWLELIPLDAVTFAAMHMSAFGRHSATEFQCPLLGLKRTLSCGRITHEIDPRFERHKVDDGPVLRRERLDISSASVVRFAERVLIALGREQGARFGKCDPAPFTRYSDNERASAASVVPSSFVRSDGAAASAPNSFPIMLVIPILGSLASLQISSIGHHRAARAFDCRRGGGERNDTTILQQPQQKLGI